MPNVHEEIAQGLKDHPARKGMRFNVLITLVEIGGSIALSQLAHHLSASNVVSYLAPIAFGGAVIFAVGGLGGAGITFALSDSPQNLTPSAAQALSLLGGDLFFPALAIGVATLTLATGIVILRSHTLPRWLGWLSILIAIIGVAGPIGFIAVIASGLWVLILAGYFYREALHPAGVTAARTTA